MSSKFQKAFTLLELLLVIAVVVILLLLLGPQLSKAQNKAKRAQCLHNLREIGIGLHNFISEKGVYPPMVASTNSENPGTWVSLIQNTGLGKPSPNTNFYNQGIWRCPTSPFEEQGGLMSYAYNAFGMSTNRNIPLGLTGRFDTNQLFVPIRESDVAVPADMFAVGDSAGGVVLSRIPIYNPGKASARHAGYWDLLFCDGHVAALPVRSVFMDTSADALARWNRDHEPHKELLRH